MFRSPPHPHPAHAKTSRASRGLPTSFTFVWMVAWVLAMACASGCTLLLDADRPQCESNADCRSRGGAFADSQCMDGQCVATSVSGATGAECEGNGDCGFGEACESGWCTPAELGDSWSCVVNAARESTEMVDVLVPVQALGTSQAVAGVAMRLCSSVDPECSTPAQEVVSTEEGVALRLAANFAGYLEVTDSRFYPLLYFLPPLRDGKTLHTLALFPPQVVDGLASAVMTEPIDTRGHVLVTVRDCKDQGVGGITLDAPRVDDLTLPYYIGMSLPEVNLSATTPEGSGGGFINMPPGVMTISFASAQSSVRVGTLTLLVRPNFISMARFEPPG